MNTRFLWTVLCALFVAACAGGSDPMPAERPLAYSSTAYTQHSYAPYNSLSHVYYWPARGAETISVGPDMSPRENLRHVLTDNGIRYYMGASRDGVGVERLRNYDKDLRSGSIGDGFRPFTVKPILRFDTDLDSATNAATRLAIFESFWILNDALPPEFEILLGESRPQGVAGFGEIMVNLASPAEVSTACGGAAVACAVSGANQSTVWIPNDFDASNSRFARGVIVHELLHALGIRGHVDSVEFPDSVMGRSGEHIPNLGYTIGRIDREVLQIMYMSQRSSIYNDWGEWSDVSHHLMGQTPSGSLQFGVALFNGLPQPWAKGTPPDLALKDNRRVAGTATWRGGLVGYSGPSPLAGDAELRVAISTLSNPNNQQDLRFRDIYFLNRYDSADPWFSTRNIDYKVRVANNAFFNTGNWSDEGVVTGTFMGRNHEHMGGTLKRTDMVGAFGGSR